MMNLRNPNATGEFLRRGGGANIGFSEVVKRLNSPPHRGNIKKLRPGPDGERVEEERDEKENAEVSRGSSEGGWSFQTGIEHSRE